MPVFLDVGRMLFFFDNLFVFVKKSSTFASRYKQPLFKRFDDAAD